MSTSYLRFWNGRRVVPLCCTPLALLSLSHFFPFFPFSLLFASLLKCFPLAPVLNHAKHFTGPAPADAPQIKGFANLAGFTFGKISRLKNAASFGGTSDPYVKLNIYIIFSVAKYLH